LFIELDQLIEALPAKSEKAYTRVPVGGQSRQEREGRVEKQLDAKVVCVHVVCKDACE
jgi:hypothetical protein